MLDFNAPELIIVAIVALLIIGPKDLPKALRFVGKWVGRARDVARQFRSGFDQMVRESELADMEKQWKAENERIMAEFPSSPAGLLGDDSAVPPPSLSAPTGTVPYDEPDYVEIVDDPVPDPPAAKRKRAPSKAAPIAAAEQPGGAVDAPPARRTRKAART